MEPLIWIKGSSPEWDRVVTEKIINDIAEIEDAHVSLRESIEATKELAELKAARCEAELAKLLHAAGKTDADARDDFYSAPWKVAIAASLRQTTSASNRWIAEKLHMGAPNSVSQYLSRRPPEAR